jgi:HEPN domain-containing protein
VPAPKFTARSYINCAQEQLGLAVRLRAQGEYFAAHFVAGISVECALRALSVTVGPGFDGTHDIEHWAKKADLLPGGSDDLKDEFRGKILEVSLRWRANQRYYTNKMLDTWLHFIALDGNVRGDRVKPSSERLLELANDIVSVGVIRWKKRS